MKLWLNDTTDIYNLKQKKLNILRKIIILFFNKFIIIIIPYDEKYEVELE